MLLRCTMKSCIFFYEIEQFLHCLCLGYGFLHTLLAFVKRYFVRACTDITIVGICHLARTIDYAAHDTYLQGLEAWVGLSSLAHRSLYAGYGALQVVERAAAARA